MLLTRKTEADGTIIAVYNSSNILESRYNGQDLTVIFKGGTSYTYKEVPATDYTRFETDESQGRTLNTHIKKKYEFVKNDKIDTTTVEAEIDEVKAAEVALFGDGLMSFMGLAAFEYNTSKTISDANLKQVAEMIVKYQELSNV